MNNKRILLFCYFLVIIGCEQGNNQKDTVIDKPRDSILIGEKISDSLIVAFQDFIPCPNIINIIKEMPDVKPSGADIRDWATDVKLFPYDENLDSVDWKSRAKTYDSITKTFNSYYYKDSVYFHVHTYKDNKKEPVIFDRIMSIYGRVGVLNVKGKDLERVFFYFRGDKDNNDIILLDIPPNWNHWQLKDELVKYLEANIDCVYLFCEGMNPCEFKNLIKESYKID